MAPPVVKALVAVASTPINRVVLVVVRRVVEQSLFGAQSLPTFKVLVAIACAPVVQQKQTSLS